jgi:hypothetical protein
MSQQFLNKLIKDTNDGVWLNGWGVNAQGNVFTFTAPKQILTKANFSLDLDKKSNEFIQFYSKFWE